MHFLDNLKNLRILVVGDLMVDAFIYGSGFRLSQEAPVPVVRVQDRIYKLGGAGNVAANLSDLGCEVYACGFIGNDISGDICKTLMGEYKINTEHIVRSEYPTILKTRVICDNQHVVRLDDERIFTDSIVENLKKDTSYYDAVIVSDYAKGTINQKLMDFICKEHKKSFIIVDPKPKNYKMYMGVNSITPNLLEARSIVGDEDASPDYCSEKILDQLKCDFVIITLSENGVLLRNKKETINMNVHPISMSDISRPQKRDVTGAGDAFISAFTAIYCSTRKPDISLMVANVAAAITVNKIGTATCSIKELREELWKDDGFQHLVN